MREVVRRVFSFPEMKTATTFEFFHEQTCAKTKTKLYVYKKHLTTCSKSLTLCQLLISVCSVENYKHGAWLFSFLESWNFQELKFPRTISQSCCAHSTRVSHSDRTLLWFVGRVVTCSSNYNAVFHVPWNFVHYKFANMLHLLVCLCFNFYIQEWDSPSCPKIPRYSYFYSNIIIRLYCYKEQYVSNMFHSQILSSFRKYSNTCYRKTFACITMHIVWRIVMRDDRHC